MLIRARLAGRARQARLATREDATSDQSRFFPKSRASRTKACGAGAVYHATSYEDIVEKFLNRHDNHRGMCRPVFAKYAGQYTQ